MSKKVSRSKFLSLVLRHKPEELEITLDENGWANVEELLQKLRLKDSSFNLTALEDIVATDEKCRYAFNEDRTKIRANQGHSIAGDVELEETEPPEVLYHGTNYELESTLRQEGIRKMSRLYVHLSLDEQTALKVGSRRSKKPIILKIAAKQMYDEGFKFYLSKNGVWLTDYVDSKYII